MAFKVENIEEPDLMFNQDEQGQNGKAKDPRIGLMKYGPRTPEGKPHHVSMKIGLIGDYYSINEIQSLFNQMRERILPRNQRSHRNSRSGKCRSQVSAVNLHLMFQ